MRRGGRALLLLLAIIVGLPVVADLAARAVAQGELTSRLRARVPSAHGASARIHSFPFLLPLLASGRVGEVDAQVRDVDVQGLRFASIAVDLHGVQLDRGQLLDARRVVLDHIDRGGVRAEIGADALASALGVDVSLEDGRASVSIAGRRISAALAVRNGRLVVDGAGVSLPALSVVAPLLPCVPDAVIEGPRLVLTCQFTEIPDELKQLR